MESCSKYQNNIPLKPLETLHSINDSSCYDMVGFSVASKNTNTEIFCNEFQLSDSSRLILTNADTIIENAGKQTSS